jgi:hypothetical protein
MTDTSPSLLPLDLPARSLLTLFSPLSASYLSDPFLSHLTFEASLFDIVYPATAELWKWRTARVYEPDSRGAFKSILDNITEQLERWRRDVIASYR